jgi:threonylcarbamoyladenosine tRNA methylthiotransferase MtaB
MQFTPLKKVYFKTFGCRTNLFDTQVMISNLKSYKITNNDFDADMIVVNSCTVTNGADTGVRSYINQIKRKNPKASIYMTGCGVTTQGETLFEEKELAGVFGHSQKEKIDDFLDREDRFFDAGSLTHVDNTIVSEFVGKTRAFIKIQEGCDFECSYCIIPSVRGKARSHNEDKIIEQIRTLADNGFGEFILTGTNVGSYGMDQNSSIAKLLKKMSLIKGVRRIRIGSLEPIQIDAEFLELLSEPWMARHLHIALQHTSDEMLKRMLRRNTYSNDLPLFEKIASHGYALGTDYIVGFPGETDALWHKAITRVKELPLTHVHAFSYSKRSGTPAATMKPEIRGDIAKLRHKELSDIIKAKNLSFRESLTTPLSLLVENEKNVDDGFLYSGNDQYFNKVELFSKTKIDETWLQIENYKVEATKNSASY